LADRVPALRPQRIIDTLLKCGLSLRRQTGGHVVIGRPGLRRPVIIGRHDKELSPATVKKILAQAEVTIEDFLSKL
jgi:predicted RNA binding protein YcfA (HicA-like mRNA interferase family)